MIYEQWLKDRANDQANSMQAQASNALGGLGVLQGAANSGLLAPYGEAFAQGLVAGAQKHAASFESEPLIQAKQTICRLTMERDEALHTVSQLAARVTEAHQEIGRLKAEHEVAAPVEQPSRIWEAIVAYSSR